MKRVGLVLLIALSIGIGIAASTFGALSFYVGVTSIGALCATILFICGVSVFELVSLWEKHYG